MRGKGATVRAAAVAARCRRGDRGYLRDGRPGPRWTGRCSSASARRIGSSSGAVSHVVSGGRAPCRAGPDHAHRLRHTAAWSCFVRRDAPGGRARCCVTVMRRRQRSMPRSTGRRRRSRVRGPGASDEYASRSLTEYLPCAGRSATSSSKPALPRPVPGLPRGKARTGSQSSSAERGRRSPPWAALARDRLGRSADSRATCTDRSASRGARGGACYRTSPAARSRISTPMRRSSR